MPGPSLQASVICAGTLVAAPSAGYADAAAPIVQTGESRTSRAWVYRAKRGLLSAIGTTPLLFGLVVMGAGCADARKTFWAEVALDIALKREFHETMSVAGPANGVLRISAEVPEAEAKKVMLAVDRQPALSIAKFARLHYSDTVGLRAITVFFITTPGGVQLHLPHSYPGMTWSVRSLDAEHDPAPTVLPDQSDLAQ